jgi:hypothetical protein
MVARIAAATETKLTPTVEDSVDQMVCHVVIFSDILMTLFAFPSSSWKFVIKQSCHFSLPDFVNFNFPLSDSLRFITRSDGSNAAAAG